MRHYTALLVQKALGKHPPIFNYQSFQASDCSVDRLAAAGGSADHLLPDTVCPPAHLDAESLTAPELAKWKELLSDLPETCAGHQRIYPSLTSRSSSGRTCSACCNRRGSRWSAPTGRAAGKAVGRLDAGTGTAPFSGERRLSASCAEGSVDAAQRAGKAVRLLGQERNHARNDRPRGCRHAKDQRLPASKALLAGQRSKALSSLTSSFTNGRSRWRCSRCFFGLSRSLPCQGGSESGKKSTGAFRPLRLPRQGISAATPSATADSSQPPHCRECFRHPADRLQPQKRPHRPQGLMEELLTKLLSLAEKED